MHTDKIARIPSNGRLLLFLFCESEKVNKKKKGTRGGKESVSGVSCLLPLNENPSSEKKSVQLHTDSVRDVEFHVAIVMSCGVTSALLSQMLHLASFAHRVLHPVCGLLGTSCPAITAYSSVLLIVAS